MCGIAGFTSKPDDLEKLLQSLQHRGPDDQGIFQSADAVLLHRRLSIIDLSAAGRQPMASDDGRYHIVYNGEIYNYVELRSELEALGVRFRSTSDTEVLLKAFIQWGIRCLPRLVGMFAFAVLDSRDRRLFLARDCFGIKPLYYSFDRGFSFASEIKTLLGGAPNVDPQCLYYYLRYGLTDVGGQTPFAGIRRLPPAHYLEISLQNPQPTDPRSYWSVNLEDRTELSFEAASEKLRELFLENVRLHLRSDVPVGAALSGGIDSSAITMAMRRLVGRKLDLYTFSYIADDAQISEERWIDLVGKESGAKVHKVKARPEELVEDLPRLIRIQDEPFGSTSIYAQFRVFQLAREKGIKVLLDGQGADEMLGGYRSFVAPRLGSLLKQGRWGEARRLFFSALRLPGTLGPMGLCRNALSFVLSPAVKSALRKDRIPAWLNERWFRDRNCRPVAGTKAGRDQLREELYRTLVQTSLPSLLRYEDRNSMAFSIESRVPFLTPSLVNFIFSLPEDYIVGPDGTSKAVFRRAMRGIVPDAILDRKDKIGFSTPEHRWLSALKPWVDRVLSSAEVPALNMKEVRKEWDGIAAGNKPFDFRVWRWINLAEWARQFNVRF
jgi:asparagine synthase (glutamine-hydrolysing)